MKKKHLFAGLAVGVGALSTPSVHAQLTTPGGTTVPYTAGDIVVYRVGDGSATLTNAGTAVFLDEYTTTGTLVGSQALSGGSAPVVASGTASSEGELTLSANGQSLLATGYAAPIGTVENTTAKPTENLTIANTATASDANGDTVVLRDVAAINNAGTVVQTTTTGYSGNNIRSAGSADGTTIYTSGAVTGILALTSGTSGTAGTLISNTLTNARNVNVAGGNLYVSTASGTTYRLAQVGSGLPTATGQTLTAVPGVPIGSTTAGAFTPLSGPYGFVGVTLTLGGTATDTFYVADNNIGAIDKFTLSGGTFTLNGTATLAGVTGLTARATPGGELLVATTPTGIYTLTDTSGAGGTLSGTPTQIVTAATNEAFRGDSFAPTVAAAPEPSTWVMMALGGFGMIAWLRRRSSHARV